MSYRPALLLMSVTCAMATQGGTRLAHADIFQLKTGGQVTGVIIDRGKQGEYVLQSDRGAIVTLSRRQVKKIVSQDTVDQLYTQRSRAYPDTVEAHHELAAWCKENRLSQQAKHHLHRILELDPTDGAARLSLGYQKHRGLWRTREGIMAARGMRKYNGDFRTPQDIALRERTKKREQAESDWFRKIRRWVSWLDDRRAEEAAERIAHVKDPYAVEAIIKILNREKNQRVRDLLTRTLAELKHPKTVTTLVNFSLLEPDQEVRLQCLEYLMQYHQPISLRPYVKALKDRDNEIVNRAAEAFLRLEDPRAISPLIDALVTTHKYRNPNAPIGNMGASFSPNGSGPGGGGGGGLNMGGNKNQVIRQNLKNLKVREALVELSGGLDYDYEKRLWRRWFVNEQIHDFVDTRRDQ